MKHVGLHLFVIVFMFFSGSHLCATEWKISYGPNDGSVKVFNSNTDKSFAEDSPYGPMAFRIVDNSLWLLDSIGGRLYVINVDRTKVQTVNIPGLNKNLLLEDFAIVTGGSGRPESVWIADASDHVIRKISLANSSELLRVGGQGNEKGKFLQIAQLEVDRGGRLYAADYGRNTISVFTQYGELIRELPWENCGFALEKTGKLHLLVYKPNAGYFHRVYSPTGQIVANRHIGLPDLQNPRIWGLNKDGGLIVSFIPAGGFKGKLKLIEFSSFSRIIRQTEFVPPGSMNRFICYSPEQTWLAKADFSVAPSGEFLVEGLAWEGKK